jgi:CheY-like chemotaxis protein
MQLDSFCVDMNRQLLHFYYTDHGSDFLETEHWFRRTREPHCSYACWHFKLPVRCKSRLRGVRAPAAPTETECRFADTRRGRPRSCKEGCLRHFNLAQRTSRSVEAIEKARKLKPDLIIIDITMPVLDGMGAAKEIKTFLPEVPILLFSMHDSRQLIREA